MAVEMAGLLPCQMSQAMTPQSGDPFMVFERSISVASSVAKMEALRLPLSKNQSRKELHVVLNWILE
jgi:hypothetical protein